MQRNMEMDGPVFRIMNPEQSSLRDINFPLPRLLKSVRVYKEFKE